jgi:nicotinamidase-related amidase
LFPETQVFSKRKFSMMTEEVTAAFKILNRTNIILCGVESHVCVLQTALTFLQGDFKHEGEEPCNVYVVCDAISSQRSGR